MPATKSIYNADIYQKYANLANRPKGLPLWEIDENGVPNNEAGEVFCRYPMETDDGETIMCDYARVDKKHLPVHIQQKHCTKEAYIAKNVSKNTGQKNKGEIARLEAFYESIMAEELVADDEEVDAQTGAMIAAAVQKAVEQKDIEHARETASLKARIEDLEAEVQRQKKLLDKGVGWDIEQEKRDILESWGVGKIG